MNLFFRMIFCGVFMMGGPLWATPLFNKSSVELEIKEPLVIKLKSKTLLIAPGTYSGVLGILPREGFFNGFFPNSYFLEASLSLPEGTEDFRINLKRTHGLKTLDQDFELELSSETEIIPQGPARSEERACVLSEFSSQENCEIVYETVCNMFKECTHEPKVQCDTQTHTIWGKHMVLFEPELKLRRSGVKFVGKKDKNLLGIARAPVSKMNTEKIISSTPCRP